MNLKIINFSNLELIKCETKARNNQSKWFQITSSVCYMHVIFQNFIKKTTFLIIRYEEIFKKVGFLWYSHFPFAMLNFNIMVNLIQYKLHQFGKKSD